MTKFFGSDKMRRLERRLERLYGRLAPRQTERLAMMIGRYGVGWYETEEPERWSERDAVLITYGDMLSRPDEHPLATLRQFCERRLQGAVSTVHLLPFFPYSSDDGFSVIDYRQVNRELGAWEDVTAFTEHFTLMFDLVLNHVSRQSAWFRHYAAGIMPERRYFHEVDPAADLGAVVRPRALPLLTEVRTRDGRRHLWTTFSDDQIDLDFSNPDVLFEFLCILFLYISKGARIIRLDAIAYLWKRIGTPCIHLPETHEVVKLLRDVMDMVAPHVILLTETNVPHAENISYFGDGDEAHMVYQFALPPLLLHTLRTGSAEALTRWAASLDEPPPGCTFFNFTASHDGIGVRPAEGLLSKKDFEALVEGTRRRGGLVGTKSNEDGSESPYELNITYFDALGDPERPDEERHIARFLCSQAVVLGLRGIPGVYFNSLLGARNDADRVERTGQRRAINRTKWCADPLDAMLDAPDSVQARVFAAYTTLLRRRAEQPAFHPDAPQRVLDLGRQFFAVERTSPAGDQTIVAVSNVGGRRRRAAVGAASPALGRAPAWRDLAADRPAAAEDGALSLGPWETVWLTPAE